jgi:hypothetical protein
MRRAATPAASDFCFGLACGWSSSSLSTKPNSSSESRRARSSSIGCAGAVVVVVVDVLVAAVARRGDFASSAATTIGSSTSISSVVSLSLSLSCFVIDDFFVASVVVVEVVVDVVVAVDVDDDVAVVAVGFSATGECCGDVFDVESCVLCVLSSSSSAVSAFVVDVDVVAFVAVLDVEAAAVDVCSDVDFECFFFAPFSETTAGASLDEVFDFVAAVVVVAVDVVLLALLLAAFVVDLSGEAVLVFLLADFNDDFFSGLTSAADDDASLFECFSVSFALLLGVLLDAVASVFLPLPLDF